jgi:hypothetical protein
MMMLSDLFPFEFSISAITIAGVTLWSLGLYLGLSPASEWFSQQLNRWFNFADRNLYISQKAFEESQQARENVNALYASLLSIIPFLIAGALCDWAVEHTLGRSWAISTGLIAVIGCGIYELGRRDGQSKD